MPRSHRCPVEMLFQALGYAKEQEKRIEGYLGGDVRVGDEDSDKGRERFAYRTRSHDGLRRAINLQLLLYTAREHYMGTTHADLQDAA